MTHAPLQLIRTALLGALLSAATPLAAQDTTSARPPRMEPMPMAGDGPRGSGDMIMPMIQNPMLPGLVGVSPSIDPFLPGAELDTDSLPWARPREIMDLAHGDTLDIQAGIVKRRIGGRVFTMYGFNEQYPGPLIRVDRDSEIHVRFTNAIDLPSTIHWHGVRLENRFDGVPGVTQEAVEPGETFWYRVRFPDAGIYWYHPHVREDIQQDLGLYGNMLVRSPRPDYYSPVNREQFLMLDDLLVEGDSLMPFGREASNFAIMGRFGNLLLVNGEDAYRLSVERGEVVRFFITNVSNTRTFNLDFDGAPMKLVAADLSRFEREMMVESVVIAPAERYVVEVRFDEAREYALSNRVQVVDHIRGEFYPAVDLLGTVSVSTPATALDYRAEFATLRDDPILADDLARFRPHFDRPVDHELLLTVDIEGLPILVMQFISIDTIYRPPVEWTDAMPNMNWLSTSNEVRWILRDTETGDENDDIAWRFRVGDVAKIRIRNDASAFHPMNHPIHLHGQRFLVLSKDGVPNRNLAWKDTVLVPVGSTIDVLMEASNPGEWMVHCHIAEHLEAGMMGSFIVEAG